jgi:acetyl-CoA carboxylase biotin carboxylase subunit
LFKKVVVANRGEIALRIIRACRELGIATVAIFSEADRSALHVRLADEAFCVGPGPSSRSYLNIPNIISTAMITGADALHPGYGFLAENARFAQICADHGIAFIGPAPDVIAQMGDKARAKEMMARSGAPVIPGCGVLSSVQEAVAAAKALGYPVLLKATAGGGGRGMRRITEERELESAFHAAESEAESNFQDGRLYMEKLILQPRHIEVQILADAHGGIVHLGERDCSIQKPSHQKLIEEAPAPSLDPELRERLCAGAVSAARACKYTNAGTLEFLVSDDDFYFMEMNTRIQVEHPVTELIFGVDLVKEQIRVAAGEPLGFTQSDLSPHGHAIECRINAEDPDRDFAPAAGLVTAVELPGGPGIRVDTQLFAGLSIPPYYDSLLAKVVAVGRTRASAISRMERALAETRIEGVKTTTDLCREILRDARFLEGGVPIDFLHAGFLSERQTVLAAGG